MNKNINFEPTFEDITTYKILEAVPENSEIQIHQNLYLDKFNELIDKYIHSSEYYEKKQYTQFKDEPGTLKCFYTCVAKIAENIAIEYQYDEFRDENDEEEIEDIEDNIFDDELNLDEISTKKLNYCNSIVIYYNNKSRKILNDIMSEIDNCIYSEVETNLFYTIGSNSYGYNLVKQETQEFELDIKLNYGPEFILVYNDMLENLKNKHHGLFLLHGEPGTGKTTMIRHLISKLCNDKKIIYIPAFMIEQIANPDFMTFLQKHKESILILEDAEFALQSRSEEYGAQAVSNLLNITNGLLNDACKIQVIATFNMDKKDIDPALLRPGRLLNEWKFDKLSVENSIELAKSLNKTFEITEPMTIAEIYAEKNNPLNKKQKRKIGF